MRTFNFRADVPFNFCLVGGGDGKGQEAQNQIPTQPALAALMQPIFHSEPAVSEFACPRRLAEASETVDT